MGNKSDEGCSPDPEPEKGNKYRSALYVISEESIKVDGRPLEHEPKRTPEQAREEIVRTALEEDGICDI